MYRRAIIFTLGLCCTALAMQPVPRGGEADRAGENEAGREARRQERRDRWQRYRTATPEERRRMRQDRWVEMTTRAYDLDEKQQQLVRAEIEAMAAERRAKMGPDAEEYDRLRDQMFEFWSRRTEAGGGEESGRGERWRQMQQDPEFMKLRDKMQELEEKHPFDMDAGRQRIERLLPNEQAKKGQARMEERRVRWEQRRQERGEPREEGRGPWAGRRDRRDGNQPRMQDQPLVGGRNDTRVAGGQPDAGQPGPVRPPEPPAAAPARPQHPWEKYTRDFIERYRLTEVQTTAAMSILKDVLNRAGQIEQANAKKVAAAQEIADPAARKARLDELNKPVEKLFEELKKRLDGLLTAPQRVKREV